MSEFRTGTLTEYAAWLAAWLEGEGQPTHYYDYPFARQTWLTAQRDFTTGGECGSQSANVIIPEGVRHTGGDLGHNTLYWMDGPALSGYTVPVFHEPVFLGLPGIAAFIAEKKRADQEERQRQRAQDQRRREAMQGSDLSRHLGQAEVSSESARDQA